MELHDRVKQKMDEHGLSQADLAARVGVKQPSINSLIHGEIKKPRFLLELADALSTSPQWLQTGQGPDDVETQPSDELQDKIAKVSAAVSIACLSVIAKLEDSGQIKGDAAPILEKAIKYFWEDFSNEKPPSPEQIKRFVLSVS